jgi:hypothetical protein
MPIDVQMPDGTIISGVPDNVTQADLLKRYQAYKPVTGAPTPDELGRYDAAKQGFPSLPEATVGSQFMGGVKQAGSDYATFLKSLGSQEAANQAAIEATKRQEEIQREVGRTRGLEDVGKAYEKSGVTGAAGEIVSQVPGAIASSGAQMGTAMAGNVAGAAAGSTIFPGLGTALGAYGGGFAALFPQFYSENLASQAKEAQEKGVPVDVSRVKAGVAATGQAALEEAGVVYAYGKNFLKGLFGKIPKTAAEKEAATQALVNSAKSTLQSVAAGTGKVALEESFVNPAQDVLERWQAGKDLFSDEAIKGYGEAVYGSLLQSPLGAAAGYQQSRSARKELGAQGLDRFGQPIPAAPTEEAKPEQAVTQPITQPTAVAPQSQSQNTQAMLEEFQNKAPVIAPLPEEQKPVETKQEPIDNVWEHIQNRDRSTPASIAQMTKIASDPDYSRVSFSRDFGTGAPIVVGNRLEPAQLGREDTVTGSDGKKIPVQYAVIDASEALASHNADGTKNPEYTQPGVKAFRAITNGRVAGLQAAYRQGTAEKYKEALLNDDLHGIDKKTVESMQNPMLVRLMQTQDVTKNIGDVSNTGAGLTFNIVEQAKNDTNRLDLSKVQFNDSGDITPQTVRDFIKAMPTTEQGNLIDKDGNPTKQAVERVDAAIFQQAYNNDKLTELAFQAQDEEARNIVRALNMAAAKAIRLQDAGNYDVRPLVNEAVELAINARRNNLSLQDAAKQADMTANPLANEIVQMFADNPRSAKAIGENLSNLFDNAYAESNKSEEDMFGNVPKRPIDQLVKESFTKEKAPDLFTEKKEKPKEEAKPEIKQFDIAKSKYDIHQEIKNLDAIGLSDWLAKNANNSAAKYIAEKINQQLKKFQKAGVKVNLIMLNGKDRHKRNVQGTSGMKLGPDKNIYYNVKINGLNSKGKADDSTIGYQILMHELLHTVSQLQIYALKNNKSADAKAIQKDLDSILRAVRKQNKIEAQKDAIDQHSASYQTRFYKNTDEIFAYGLSNHSLQDYLSTIKVGDKTAFTKLVEIVRKLLGIDAKYDTALDKLMRVGDRIFEMSTDEISELAKKHNWNFGEGTLPESAGIAENEAVPTPSKGIPDIIRNLIKKPKAEAKPEPREPGESSKPAEGRNYKGQPVQASWSFAEDNVKHWHGISDEAVDNFIYKIQDKQIDTKRAQEAIQKVVGEIDDDINVYDKEQLYHGRTATGIREFLLDELLPAIKELKKLGLTPQEIKDYLHNRHAEERNNKMNEVNKKDPITGKERETPWELQDRASGISTADAKSYMSKLDPKKKEALNKVADQFDKMVQGTQKILLDSGAEDQSTINAWNETYKHYVPLFRIEDDFAKFGGFGATGASKGFGTRGKFSKRAMGSEKEVQDILGNLIAQRERALIRAEKIKVGKALYGLTLMNPNPDVWLPVNPDAIKSKEALIAELKGLGFEDAESIANNLMEEPKTRYISKEKKLVNDPDTGLPVQTTEEGVKLKIDNLKRFGDNVFPVRINGKDRYIFFNKNNPQAQRMVHSLLNLDADSLGTIEGVIGRATRWFASVNTQYNPIFGAVNLIRDFGGANFNLTSTPLAGKQGEVNKGIFPAMRGILNVLRDERKGKTDTTGKWAKAFQEFRKEGGQTGYRDSLIRTDEEKQIVEHELNKLKPGSNVKKAFSKVMGALSDFNDMMENSIRVSAYMAARKPKSEGGLGLSKQQAAVLAKNLTVNFDKKGQLSARVNAYYAFFNASVQGTARLAQTLKGPKGKAIIAGGIGLGTMQAVILAMAGFRDDEPPEFVKERNFIIPTPNGKYITIPYPLGLHILPNFGRITTEFVLNGGKNAGKKVANLTGATMDAFSPVGSSGLSIQSVLPTVLDPLAALESNKDAFGRPIYKEDRATNPTPGYMRSRESASEISKQISYFLNLASGGGKYSKGFFSPTADEIDYVAGQVTGGAGRELLKAEQAIKAGITGEELPAYRVPLAGRFYGETESNAAESQRFYSNITKMADYENEVKGRIKNKEPVAPYLAENPQARFWQLANTVENQVNALNKQKKEFVEKGLPKDRIKRIDNQKALLMKRFNDHLAKYED